MIGQNQAVELLQQAIAHQRIAPAYLFAGPAGVGRALGAKSFCQWLLCLDVKKEKQALIQEKIINGNHPDLLWVEPTYQYQGKLLSAKEAEESGIKRKAPPQIRIEQIREITQFLSRPPLEASRAVVVIEDANTMTEAAANALLKTLEEPGRATIILIVPSTDTLLPTLVSRCQRIPFYRLSEEDLKQIIENNQPEIIREHPELLQIAQGSPGEAIKAYQQIKSIPAELLHKLTQIPQNSLEAFQLAKTITEELDIQLQLWLLDYLQYSHWQKNREPKVLKSIEKARDYLLAYVQPRLVWECTLLELLSPDRSRAQINPE